MTQYKFRLHFILANAATLAIPSPTWIYENRSQNIRLTLRPLKRTENINNEKELELIGEEWPSEEEAWKQGNLFRDALVRTLIQFHLGANFGDDRSHGGFTKYVIDKLKEETGLVIKNDYIGISVYESGVPTSFAHSGPVSLSISIPSQRFEEAFLSFVGEPKSFTPREKLAITLYNNSFFESSPEARFLVLVMAIEALLDPNPRGKEAMEMIQCFIQMTEDHPKLGRGEKESIKGSLQWLLDESISKTGRDLVSKCLGGKKFLDRTPAQFFTYCYNLRSQLVHGNENRPTADEIGKVAANLETFVADLLNSILGESTYSY